MSYGEFARLTATPLDRAVDTAIVRENEYELLLMAKEQAACSHPDTERRVWGDQPAYRVTVCLACGRREYDPDAELTPKETVSNARA